MMGLSSKRRPPAVLVAAVVAASVLLGCRERTKPPATKRATQPAGQSEAHESNQPERRSLEKLLGALKHTNPDVRAQAAMDLGRLADRKAVDPLVAALADRDAVVRARAGVSLGQIGDPRAIQRLLETMKDSTLTWEYRLDPSQGLVVLGSVAVDPLLTTVQDEKQDAAYRARAIWILGRLGDRRAVKPLLALLKDPQSSVRYSAVVALGFLRDARASQALRAIRKDPKESVAKAASQAMARIAKGGVAAVNSSDPQEVQAAAHRLAEALKADDIHLGWHLSKAILAADPPLTATALSTVLGRADLGARRSPIISAVSFIKLRQCAPKLIQLLGQPDVQRQSVMALGTLGDPSAIPPLEKLLKANGDPNLAHRVRVALGQLGRPYTQYFIRGLADSERERRRSAMYALTDVGDLRAVPALYRVLYMPRYWDGHNAANAIERLTGIPVRGVDKDGHPSQRSMEEIRRDVRKWMVERAAKLNKPLEASPEAWPFSPPPPLYVDLIPRLRQGMTRPQVKAILGQEPIRFSERDVEHFSRDVSGRSLTMYFVRKDGADVLQAWTLGELPRAAQQAVAAVKKRPVLSLRLLEVRWNGDFTGTVRNQRLWLDTSVEALAKARRAGQPLTAEQAVQVAEALAIEGFLPPDTPQRRWPWPAAKDYAGGVWVLQVGAEERIVGPGIPLLRLLARVGSVLPGNKRKPIEAAAAEVARKMGTRAYELPSLGLAEPRPRR